MVTSASSENHENEGFWGLSKVKAKRLLVQMKQNSSTELLGHSFLEIYSKNAPPDPPRPQMRIFAGFPRIFLLEHTNTRILPKHNLLDLNETDGLMTADLLARDGLRMPESYKINTRVQPFRHLLGHALVIDSSDLVITPPLAFKKFHVSARD